ncbi:MAG TPA: DUF6175 family protein, partial [Bacteroidales bacterium]|nr:DUF6175 family protein [Bacteroidales bacterium]
MKKNTQLWMIVALMLCLGANAFSQAKKPTIMVVPSDVWCNKNGYMLSFDNQGTTQKFPDFKSALQENSDLLLVISKINELMADRGFPLKNLESALKTLQNESAEDAMLTSKNGSEIAESPIDKLKKVAKADIWMQVTWTINNVGPKKSITFNLQGIDAYTDKQIAGASGTGPESFSVVLPVLLEEAVLSHLDNFNAQLQKHFDDLFANGREIAMRVKVWDSFDGDLETERDGKELGEIIEKWVGDNTVEHRFSTSDATESMMLFEQVRIPLYNASGSAMDARSWGQELRKYLKSTYSIESKVMTKGLG